MMKNLDAYEGHMKEAASQGVQIILFNEYGLYGTFGGDPTRNKVYPYLEQIPDPSGSKINPCTNSSFSDRPVLQRASCLARQYKMVMVLNMGDIQPCTIRPCPPGQRYQYNTLIALSESGEILAKYHKMHLFFEKQFDTPSTPDITYFDTSFGVRFGLAICFDLMYEQPGVDLVKQGIKDILFSSWWFNQPPLVTGQQYQQAWSRQFGVNMLASGSGQSWTTSGSGIYSKGEVLTAYFNPTTLGQDKLLVATIPILNIDEPRNIPTTFLAHKALPPHDPVITQFTATPGKTASVDAIDGTLHCNAQYTINAHTSAASYALVAYAGPYSDFYYEEICCLVHCFTQDANCYDPTFFSIDGLWASTVFDMFKVSGTFSQGITLFGLVGTNESQLIPPNQYNVIGSALQSSSGFNQILLDATIFGVKLA